MPEKKLVQLNIVEKNQETKFSKFKKVSLHCLMSLILCVLAVYILKYGFLLFITFLSYSDLFRIKNIIINCDEKNVKEEVLLLTGLDNDQSILKQNLKNLKMKILKHPSVIDVKIKRQLPDKLLISLKTRKPIAIGSLDKLYFVDEQGHAYKRVSVLDNYDYPVITGIMGNNIKETEKRLKDATEVLRRLKEIAPEFLSWGVSEIHYVDERFIDMYMKDIRASVHIHTPELQDEIQKLTRAILYLRETGLLNKVIQIIPYHRSGVAVMLKEKL